VKSVLKSKYMGSREDEGSSGIVMLGCPLDATSSFRGGTKFAPDSIRRASWTLETYSPYLKQDLDDVDFYDAGDLELRQGSLDYSLDLVQAAIAEIVTRGKTPLLLGGEHLLTFPALKAVQRAHGALQVVHFDAHCDLRDEYEGQRLSHATVMKRVKEIDGSRVLQIGVRSGTRQEFQELVPAESPEFLAAQIVRGMPTYVTFDMDVLDPSLVPGVTTPEPGGLTFKELMAYFPVLLGAHIVGADVVELSPDYDTTFVSSVCASKVVRELLMLLHFSEKGDRGPIKLPGGIE
jgi:agmatinase